MPVPPPAAAPSELRRREAGAPVETLLTRLRHDVRALDQEGHLPKADPSAPPDVLARERGAGVDRDARERAAGVVENGLAAADLVRWGVAYPEPAARVWPRQRKDKGLRMLIQSPLVMARPIRFELTTFGSAIRRSIQLSYGRTSRGVPAWVGIITCLVVESTFSALGLPHQILTSCHGFP